MTSFGLIDSISLPGDPQKPNDDALGIIGNAAVVFDGATGLGEPLMPGSSDAAWLAQFGARRLLARLHEGDAPRDAVRRAMQDAEKSFTALRRREPAETYEIPFASMMLVAGTEQGFHALWFGDCAALVKYPDQAISIIGETLVKRELEAARVAGLAAKHALAPATGHDRPEFLHALRRARNTVNTQKGGWLFGPNPIAADHVAQRSVRASQGTLILLATDGFLALVSDYRRYDAEALFAAAVSDGLGKLGRELREIETEDPEGRRYPRFKASDDATAVLLRIA
jgi:hypothetical protein